MQSRLVLVRDKRTYSARLRISTTDLSQEEPMALKEELAAQKARALRFLIDKEK
jgi:type IV secretory pathway VirB9-like protein